jgi:hypothetical protein
MEQVEYTILVTEGTMQVFVTRNFQFCGVQALHFIAWRIIVNWKFESLARRSSRLASSSSALYELQQDYTYWNTNHFPEDDPGDSRCPTRCKTDPKGCRPNESSLRNVYERSVSSHVGGGTISWVGRFYSKEITIYRLDISAVGLG